MKKTTLLLVSAISLVEGGFSGCQADSDFADSKRVTTSRTINSDGSTSYVVTTSPNEQKYSDVYAGEVRGGFRSAGSVQPGLPVLLPEKRRERGCSESFSSIGGSSNTLELDAQHGRRRYVQASTDINGLNVVGGFGVKEATDFSPIRGHSIALAAGRTSAGIGNGLLGSATGINRASSIGGCSVIGSAAVAKPAGFFSSAGGIRSNGVGPAVASSRPVMTGNSNSYGFGSTSNFGQTFNSGTTYSHSYDSSYMAPQPVYDTNIKIGQHNYVDG